MYHLLNGLKKIKKLWYVLDEGKTKNTAITIANVYEQEKEGLSDNTRTLYFMDVERLSLEQTEKNY